MLEGAFHKSSFMHESQAIYLRLYEQFPIQAFIFLPFLTHSRSRIQADFSLVLILRKWEGKCGFPETPTVNLLPQLISNYQDQWVSVSLTSYRTRPRSLKGYQGQNKGQDDSFEDRL